MEVKITEQGDTCLEEHYAVESGCRYKCRVIRWKCLPKEKHGLEVTYDIKGRVLISIPWQNGVKEGIEERWMESEEGIARRESYWDDETFKVEYKYIQDKFYWKYAVIPWINGKKHGIEEGYWYNGQKSLQVSWAFGLQDGHADYFHLDGGKHIVSDWSQGKKLWVEFYFLNGKLSSSKGY